MVFCDTVHLEGDGADYFVVALHDEEASTHVRAYGTLRIYLDTLPCAIPAAVSDAIREHAAREFTSARARFETHVPGVDALRQAFDDWEDETLPELRRQYPRAALWIAIQDLYQRGHPDSLQWGAADLCERVLLGGGALEVARAVFDAGMSLPPSGVDYVDSTSATEVRVAFHRRDAEAVSALYARYPAVVLWKRAWTLLWRENSHSLRRRVLDRCMELINERESYDDCKIAMDALEATQRSEGQQAANRRD